jgi:hypothetical protein
MQALLNTPLLSTKQVKKFVQRDAKLFTINVHGPINESMNENGINEMLGNSFIKECSNVFFVDLPSLPLDENILRWYHSEPPQGMVKEPKTTRSFS